MICFIIFFCHMTLNFFLYFFFKYCFALLKSFGEYVLFFFFLILSAIYIFGMFLVFFLCWFVYILYFWNQFWNLLKKLGIYLFNYFYCHTRCVWLVSFSAKVSIGFSGLGISVFALQSETTCATHSQRHREGFKKKNGTLNFDQTFKSPLSPVKCSECTCSIRNLFS